VVYEHSSASRRISGGVAASVKCWVELIFCFAKVLAGVDLGQAAVFVAIVALLAIFLRIGISGD